MAVIFQATKTTTTHRSRSLPFYFILCL